MASTPRVLLVDDDPDFLRLAKRQLGSNQTFELVTASTGEEAVELLGERSMDAVVSDSVRASGESFLRAAREIDSDVPLILYTGSPWEDVADDAIAVNVTDYMRKGSTTIQTVERRLASLLSLDDVAGDESSGRDVSIVPPQPRLGQRWETITRFDPATPRTDLDVLIVESIADYLGVDPESLDALYDSVDADALAELVLPRTADGDQPRVVVRFEYAGEAVAITSDGQLAVDTQG